MAPAHRRRGHGTALLSAVRALAPREHRSSLLLEADRDPAVPVERSPDSAFLLAHGFTLRLQSTRRDLRLPVDPAHVDRLLARLTTDTPLGDLDYEPESWDAARVAEWEDEVEAMGITRWTAVAVAADGAWAGFTDLGWSPRDPERLHQWDTLVLREHRGAGSGCC